MLVVGICQEHSSIWVTKILRVQFEESTGLQSYSGCYKIDHRGIEHSKRKNYNGFSANEEVGVFAYCKDERNWILFKNDVGNGSDTVDMPINNPCNLSRGNYLASSSTNGAFDVLTSFEESWYSASGLPLDLYTFETEDYGEDLMKTCDSFLSNGVCNNFFNKPNYQYDGGDCCASTCTPSDCGTDGITSAFGEGVTGVGFPNCKDPDMVSVTIYLNSITSSRNKEVLKVSEDLVEEYYLEKGIGFWTEKPEAPFFIVHCDGVNVLSTFIYNSMENKSETIKVKDGARCEIDVANITNSMNKWDNDAIWWVDYTVYHGNDTTNEIISGYSGDDKSKSFNLIPKCYFEKLPDSINISTAYLPNNVPANALTWLANEDIWCEDKFLRERFALSAMNFAAPIIASTSNTPNNYLWITPQEQCLWEDIGCTNEGSVKTLSVRSKGLNGIISTTVGLLTGLQRWKYDGNGLIGTIPSEIGMLTNLNGLDIDNNELTGTIPTEFGKLVKMIELDLDQNRLNGTIPTEFGLMIDARKFDLAYNELKGTIPIEIGNLVNMAAFSVVGNTLTGPIPTEIGTMLKIEELLLAHNKISGTISSQIHNTNLTIKRLWLSNNTIDGTIPPEIGKLSMLGQFLLDRNQLTGSIPSEVGSMTSLSIFDLYGNYLEGTIPTELGLLTNLREIRLEQNLFTGTIPTEIALLDQLRVLTFDREYLTGDIPSNIKTLATCHVCDGNTNYELKPERNNENIVFSENGLLDAEDFSCRSLLERMWDKDKFMSANACNTLRNICTLCSDDAPYIDEWQEKHETKEKRKFDSIGI